MANAAVTDDQPARRFAKDILKAFVRARSSASKRKRRRPRRYPRRLCRSKGNGFDIKALRTVVKLRKLDVNERKEQEAVLEPT